MYLSILWAMLDVSKTFWPKIVWTETVSVQRIRRIFDQWTLWLDTFLCKFHINAAIKLATHFQLISFGLSWIIQNSFDTVIDWNPETNALFCIDISRICKHECLVIYWVNTPVGIKKWGIELVVNMTYIYWITL